MKKKIYFSDTKFDGFMLMISERKVWEKQAVNKQYKSGRVFMRWYVKWNILFNVPLRHISWYDNKKHVAQKNDADMYPNAITIYSAVLIKNWE